MRASATVEGTGEKQHGGNNRKDGDGSAQPYRAPDDGVQEGADRGRRRPGQGRGVVADPQRRQGDESRRSRRGGEPSGVWVAYEGGDEPTGKDVAMHVAASAAPGAARPIAVSRNEVPPEVIERERAIYTAQAAESGKPAEIVARMVDGRLNKFL